MPGLSFQDLTSHLLRPSILPTNKSHQITLIIARGHVISAVGSFIWKVLSYVYECMTVVLTALQKHTLADSTLQQYCNNIKHVEACDKVWWKKRETPKPSAKDSYAQGARHRPYPYALRTFHQGLRIAGRTDVPWCLEPIRIHWYYSNCPDNVLIMLNHFQSK